MRLIWQGCHGSVAGRSTMGDEDKAVANRTARNEKKEAYLRAIYDRYTAEFRATADQDASSVANKTHKAISAVLEQDRAKNPGSENIQCGKGCNHCCHEAVEIWPQEAALLAGVVRETSMTLDMARLERQSQFTVDSWRQQPRADKACLFLGSDGACTVYESRPNACRKLLVVTDPALCDAEKSKPDSVGRWFSWEAELMESAALEVFGAGLMPRSLLTALNAK
jgi:Fe-S-cluster containining protein